jgi:isovaleryl-CoA dehydrogenase
VALTQYQTKLYDFFNQKDPSGQLASIYESATEFSQKIIAPHDREMTASGAFHQPLWKMMGEQGFQGIMMPEYYGGTDLGHTALYAIVSAIAYASGSAALSFVADVDLCTGRIKRHGNDEQKEKYLPGLINGTLTGALAMSEPGAGSDVMSAKTRAVADGDGYVLNGNKMWITNAPHADVLVVYARSENPGEKRAITAFVVDKDTPGFSVGPKIDKIGMCGSETAPIYFDDCYLPKENILGKLHHGAEILFPGLRDERLGLAYIADGLMRRCLDTVVEHTTTRKQFGKVLFENQGVSFPIVDNDVNMTALQLMLMNGAELAESKSDKWTDAAAAKIFLFSSQAAITTGLNSINLCGGMGYTHDLPVGRAMNDAILLGIGGGAQNIQRLVIGRDIASLR